MLTAPKAITCLMRGERKTQQLGPRTLVAQGHLRLCRNDHHQRRGREVRALGPLHLPVREVGRLDPVRLAYSGGREGDLVIRDSSRYRLSAVFQGDARESGLGFGYPAPFGRTVSHEW